MQLISNKQNLRKIYIYNSSTFLLTHNFYNKFPASEQKSKPYFCVQRFDKKQTPKLFEIIF